MAIIGNPIVSTDFPVDYFSGNASTTAFTLSIAPASVNAVDVEVSGVSQSPQTYTLSGTTLTFSAAPPTGTNNIVIKHRGIAGTPNVPSTGSVGPSHINPSYSLWNLSGSDVTYTAGNVGIGTSSPSYALDVRSASAPVIRLSRSGTAGQIASIVFEDGNSTLGSGSTTRIASESGATTFNTGGTSGSVTGGTERMRILSSGIVCIGRTTPTLGNRAFNIQASDVCASLYRPSSSTGDEVFEVRSDVGGTNIQTLKITANGNVTNTNGSYSSYSDIKLKENIVDASPKLDKLNQIRVVNYNLIGSQEKHIGVIAQELEQICPSLIEESKDVDNDGNDLGTITKGVKYSIFVPMLIKAIQELKAEVDTLKTTVETQATEIAALKGTV